MTFGTLLLSLCDTTSRGRQVFRLEKPFRFSSSLGLRVTVPSGFCTDFASVPRFFWRVFPPAGRHARAAVIHDYLYSRAAACPRLLADAVFRHAMEISGVSWWRRTTMYYAVRLFGWLAYQRQ